MKSRLALFLLGTPCVACSALPGDPGWDYSGANGVAIMEDGKRWKLSPGGETQLVIMASAFAGKIDVELDVENVSGAPLAVDLTSLVVKDAKGRSLSKRFDSSERRCRGRLEGEVCTLAVGQSCRLAGTFRANPFASGLAGYFRKRNPDLSVVVVEVRPIADAGQKRAPIRATLNWTE